MVVIKCDNCNHCNDVDDKITCNKGHWNGWDDYNAISDRADTTGDIFKHCVDFTKRKKEAELMKNKISWDYVEEQAQKKLNLSSSSWQLGAIEVIDAEIVRATLKNDFSRATETCLVIYAQKEEK